MDAKITQLSDGTPVISDIIPYVSDPGGTPITKKSTLQHVADIFATLSQVLTNKTFTSPTINTPIITTPTLRNYDGWIDANESWVYASPSTITVPAGALLKYAVGDRIRFTQTTVKYGVITAVADTLLTIAVNTDYPLVSAAISANYYSHEASPIGYPGWFSYTPTITWVGTPPTSPTYSLAIFSITGHSCTTIVMEINYSGVGVGNTSVNVTLPVATTGYQTGYGSIQSNDTPNVTTTLITYAGASVVCNTVAANRLYFNSTFYF